MPSGRKRGKNEASEDSNVSVGKRIKPEPKDGDQNGDDGENISWEWEDDGHVWKTFSDDLQTQIQSAFKEKLAKTKIVINDTKFDVIFERMVQRNSTTFWERRIRVNKPGDDGGLEGDYEYKDSVGNWVKFNQNIQRLIYAANLFDIDKVTYTHQRVKFAVDLVNMMEINEKKNTKRKLRKDGVTPDEEEESETNTTNNSNGDQIKNEDVQEEEEEKEEPKRKSKRKIPDNSNNNNNKKATANLENSGEEQEIRSISFKGKAPVDPECFSKQKYHVYYEANDIYDAMLNQTNLKNNNNKFYLMQVLQTNTGTSYAVWFRWGRVGMTGQTNLINCGTDLEKAKDTFLKKFFDKTKNEFFDRKRFKKVPGKYDLLIMDYKATDKDEVDAPKEEKMEKKIPESKLDKKLQVLVELLCNIKEMEETVVEMKYDTKKAPLGKLTKDQIKAGYKALKKIEQCITKKTTGNELILACDAFYTRVPHCFGMQRPPVIRTKQEVKAKVDLLETLGDIEIAMKVIKDEGDRLLNPIDQHYLALKCELAALHRGCDEFQVIEKYTQNTHAKTHNQYKMEILNVFQIDKCQQNNKFKDVGNRMLLWHGSRLTNWVGILSQGLRIAPPEAPVTGYMFGKGIYFADMSSKSANYCYPTRTKNVGFVLLCEVSLGKSNDLLAADYEADQLPAGCHSTRGLGKVAPNDKENHVLPDGVMVPLGKGVDTGITNPDGYTLNYNEYVVYDTNQVKARYLVQIKFNFK